MPGTWISRRIGLSVLALAAFFFGAAQALAAGIYSPVVGSPFAAPVASIVEFSPSGRMVAVGGGTASAGSQVSAASLYAIGRTGHLYKLSGSLRSGSITGIGLGQFSPNGKFVVVWRGLSRMGIYRVTRTGLGARQGSWYFPPSLNAEAATFNPRSNLLAVLSVRPHHRAGMLVWVFNVSRSGRLRNISGSPFPVGTEFGSSDGIAFSPDGRYLANLDNEASGGARVELYPVAPDGALGHPVASVGCGGDARALAFSQRGDHLGVVDYGFGGHGRVWVFQVKSDGSLRVAPGSPSKSGPGGGVESLSFTGSGRRLAVLNSLGSNVTVFSVGRSGGLARIATLRSTLLRPADAALSPDGRLLAVANYGDSSVAMFAEK